MNKEFSQGDYLIIADRQGLIQQIIGREDDFGHKMVGRMLSSIVIPNHFQNIMNFLINIKDKKIDIGWEFCLQEGPNKVLTLFSGILIRKNKILIIAQNLLGSINRLLPEDIKTEKNTCKKLLKKYYLEKQMTLTTEDDNRQDKFYQQYSQMNNELVNLQREMVKKNKEIEEEKRRFTHFASTDLLTGIYNRRMGMELLNKEIKVASRRNSFLSICFLDVDGLKEVNDQYGHQEGDRLLIKISDTIKNNIRESDIFCRMGGDEFLIIFPDSSEEAAEGIWQRILTDFQMINRTQECKYPMHVSHGIVEYRTNRFPKGKEIDSLIETADKKMYQEKEQHAK
ncbi:MAG: GGDEF domain-containing protein [Atribacterota bacterium]|nr:GGDEF domain-containing protein [Atribacterota bacterium]